jgi:hypothetical protein
MRGLMRRRGKMSSPESYTQDKHYLPDFMKDFHDQKDLFKAIYELYKDDENLKKLPQGWVDNHIFVVDFFLWFMGQHGYKLQKVRKKGVDFYDLKTTIEEMKGRSTKRFMDILKSHENKSGEPNEITQ